MTVYRSNRSVWKLLVLDRNTWYHITVCKSFVLNRNTWYYITMQTNYYRKIKKCNLKISDCNGILKMLWLLSNFDIK